MRLIWSARNRCREHGWDWWDRDYETSIWREHGIAPSPSLQTAARSFRDRSAARQWIALEDWRDRVARKRRVSVRFRQIVVARADGSCSYCGREVPEGTFDIDHVIPVTRGGRSVLRNLAAACSVCNRDKSDLLLKEWLDRWYYRFLKLGIPLPPINSAS